MFRLLKLTFGFYALVYHSLYSLLNVLLYGMNVCVWLLCLRIMVMNDSTSMPCVLSMVLHYSFDKALLDSCGRNCIVHIVHNSADSLFPVMYLIHVPSFLARFLTLVYCVT